MASTGVFALTRFTALASGDVIPVVDISNTSQNAHGSLLSIIASDFYASALPITVPAGTVTVSTPVFQATETWNAGGVTFTAIDLNITDTASASGSLLANLRVGGTSKWKVDKSGNVTAVGTIGGAAGTFTATSGAQVTAAYDGTHTYTVTVDSSGNAVLNATGTITLTPNTTISGTLTQTGLATFNNGATVASGKTLTLTGATVAGTPTWSSNQAITLSTAAQPNVTSVGTLTSLTVSGTLTPQALIDASGASAGQIKFPASQNASSNANTFDDYKEALANGSWTPTDASGAGLTLTTDGCVYTKIGRLVIASFSITYPATGNGADNLIDSLPYTVLSLPTNAQLVSISFTNVGTAMTGVLSGGTAQFVLRNAATGTPLTNAQLSGKIIRGTAIYLASA